MKIRLRVVLLFLVIAATLALGLFLLFAANQTPVPGLLLIGISGIALLRYLLPTRNRAIDNDEDDALFEATKKDLESYEIEQERRQRGEYDI
jgi:NhaP-type Na+/H+ or K+/H+ antiporter